DDARDRWGSAECKLGPSGSLRKPLPPIVLGGGRIALLRRAHAAAAGSAQQDALPRLEHHVFAVVHCGAIDADFSTRAGLPALHAGCRKAAALGHEDDADWRVRDHLELDLLPEPATIATRAAAVRAQLLPVHEQRAVALDQ